MINGTISSVKLNSQNIGKLFLRNATQTFSITFQVQVGCFLAQPCLNNEVHLSFTVLPEFQVSYPKAVK